MAYLIPDRIGVKSPAQLKLNYIQIFTNNSLGIIYM